MLSFISYSGETGVTVVLTAMPGATGTPAGSYAVTETSATVYEIASIPQTLTGEWHVLAKNGSNSPIFSGYWTVGEARCYDYSKSAVDLNPVLDAIDQINAKIETGKAFLSKPVSAQGVFKELILGMDYKTELGNALEWSVDPLVGMALDQCSCKLGITNSEGVRVLLVTGTVFLSGGKWKTALQVDKDTTINLLPEKCDYSVEIYDSTNSITIKHNDGECDRVTLVKKQTWPT